MRTLVIPFLLLLNLNVFAQKGDGADSLFRKEKDVFETMQNYSSTSITARQIIGKNLSLSSLIHPDITDSMMVAHGWLETIDTSKIGGFKQLIYSLSLLNNTYWKPSYIVWDELNKAFSSISKPIFYGEDYAFIIGYNISGSMYQQIFLLKKENEDWSVIKKLNVGIYLKYSSK